MNIRRLTALAMLLGLSGALVAACGQDGDGSKSIHTDKIDVGLVADSPGFSYSNGESDEQGFDVDLAYGVVKNLARAADKDQKLVRIPINNVGQRDQRLLDGDMALVVAAYSITEARNKRGVDFAGPYLKTDQAFLTRAGEDKITREDLAGRPVCVANGTTADQETRSWVGSKAFPLVQSRPAKLSECIKLLQDREVDAVFDDEMVLYGYLGEYEKEFEVQLPGSFGQVQYYGIGIAGGHHDDCLLVNEALRSYLHEQWKTDFSNNFKEIPPARYRTVNPFLPDEGDMAQLSCQIPDKSDN